MDTNVGWVVDSMIRFRKNQIGNKRDRREDEERPSRRNTPRVAKGNPRRRPSHRRRVTSGGGGVWGATSWMEKICGGWAGKRRTTRSVVMAQGP